MSSAVVSSGQLFEQDDEETLDLLLSVSIQDMQDCLDGMEARFQDDFKVDDAFWNDLIKSAQELGFRFTGVSTSPPIDTDAPPLSFPAAFDTTSGKQHIQATSSLLRISKTRAVKLTLSALRALNGGDDAGDTHIQSLLGTRDLLKTVRDYHYQQRLARLQVITECLRVEQDNDAPHKEQVTSMLDTLDKTYLLNGRIRGLFQILQSTACAPYSPPTRDELLPTLQLRFETPETLQEAQSQSTYSDAFVTNCFQASRQQTLRERVQAMEALLVLLYHRIDQGIHKSDYALVLLAFESCGTFFTTLGNNKRCCHLAGLICAECASLWMTACTELNDCGVPLWILRHPILQGVLQGNDAAVHEMEALLLLVTKFANQVSARKLRGLTIAQPSLPLHDNAVVEAPESIALFSFGLLLCLVATHMPAVAEEESLRFDFEKHGMECAQIASDDCGVFDYLHATMEALVKTPICDSFSSESNLPYDWQFTGDSSPFLLEGRSEQEELNAADVAYASIGLELLSSTIIAFQSTIRTGNCISLENVTMLCSLAATIYGNHPLLCQAFWKNLELYTSVTPRREESLASKHALCYLVDAAHACATSALNAAALASVGDHPGLEEDMLPSLVPLVQLMSALCSSSDMVESVLKLLPKGMVRLSLLCCAPASAVKDSAAFTKNALQIVEAVRNLARVGRSSNCRAMLRSALEEEGDGVVDGPRVLYRILSSQQDTNIVSSVLRLIGYFVESAAGEEVWVAKMAKHFGPYGLGNNGLQALLTGPSSSVALSALHVLSGFVGNMTSIAFCPKCEHIDTLDALYVVTNGVMPACTLLTSLLSSTPNQDGMTEGLSFLVAHGVLRCLAMFLRQLRPIINMHASLRVKSAAQQAREVLIQNLSTSTSVGQAIAYFASAPVSLSLAIELEEMLRNANVMQIASDEYARETDPLDFGAWRSITDASRENKPAVEFAKVRLEAQNLVSNIHELDLDLQGFQENGWTNEATAMEPLLAASAALDLLVIWELSVDEIVSEQHGIRTGDEASLGKAAAVELRALSPCRLTFSQIVKPPIVEATASLKVVWPTDSYTLFDVLLRYLGEACVENGGDAFSENVPSLVAADVLSLALVNAKLFDQTHRILFSDVVIRCAPELMLVLNEAVVNAAVLTSGPSETLTRKDDGQVRKGLACLRLLSTCFELDPRVIVAICGSESSLLDGIINILNSAASSLRADTSFDHLCVDARSTSLLRVASASVHALLTLWKLSCMANMSREVTDIVVATRRNVIADVISIVESSSLSLSTASLVEEPNAVHVAAVVISLASGALEILTVEMSRKSEDSQQARSAVGDILKASFPSLSVAFSKINAAVTTARSWSKLDSLMHPLTHVGVHDPRALLCSFSASHRCQIESHETQENLCDIVAASSWLLSLLQESHSSVGTLKMNNACFILLSKQLNLVSSWGKFATMFSLATEGDREMPDNATLTTVSTVLIDIGRIATVIEEAQMLVSENYLPLDVGIAADTLSGLLVETLNRYSRMTRTMQTTNSSELARIYELLAELGSTMEKLLSSTCLNRPSRHIISLVLPTYQMRDTSKVREDTAQMCCALQMRLLTAAGLFFTAVDQISSQGTSALEDNRLADAAVKFVEMACKGIELVNSLYGSAPVIVPAADGQVGLSQGLLEASVSLLTVLLSRERGSKMMLTGENQFFASAAASMKKANVMQSLVAHVDVASRLAVNASSKAQSQATAVPPANESHVRVVQTIFSFIRTVAEIGHKSDDMLSLLSSTGLSKMIVDNPLLIAANKNWVSDWYGGDHIITGQPRSTALRGYIPLAEMPVGTPEGGSRTIVTGTFLSGKDDPVHVVFRTALKILKTIVSAYGRPRDTVSRSSRNFLEVAIAFLKTYHASLIACLEQCSSISSDSRRGMTPATSSAAHVSHVVLTFNSLCETADILALVSSLCSGEHLQLFESVCRDVYNGMIRACHSVLDGLSEFLAAAGTAKEIFTAMKDYDAEYQENANRESDLRFGFNEVQVEIDPLLSAGIPTARHEAIKHAHYANRCCALVTSEDYKGLPKVPDTSGNGSFSTSSLERDSQLSMNSPFMFRMEHAAAECIAAAITVLTETHPASYCFVMFSPEELRRRDMLSLLRPEMIVSAIPDSTSDVCHYYRILRVDTVRRLCHVLPLDDKGAQAQQILDVDKVNGVEDTSKRKPVLSFSAAPSSFADLESSVALNRQTASLGDVVNVLKWCYQCAGDSLDSDERKMFRKILAESASALLSTEMSLHEAIGTFSMTNPDELSRRVMSQLLQLYEDSPKAPKWSGQLKQVMEPSMWHAVQQQLADELNLARREQREKKLQSLNRAAGVNGPSPWFSASRQVGALNLAGR